MQDFFATLKEYIANEKPKRRTCGAKSLLEMLYDVYTEFNINQQEVSHLYRWRDELPPISVVFPVG